ncbi:MAG: ABC transporter ATP-binding protein [Candidatus Hydrogenedentes bacterium]|nr:ABC transporter ATP-binding protein [Candidatus Hydrogenedentota bacterium]
MTVAVASIARLEQVTKTYYMGSEKLDALGGIDIDILEGEYVAIMGPSGCGKSTLLNILGCLDRPTSGHYILGDVDVSQMEDDSLSEVRGSKLGFIFQSYNLIQQLTVIENIEVPLYYQGIAGEASRDIAVEMAKRVGLGDRLDHKPFELSGGQQQRVGIARSLVNDPIVLLADEPTGNLDSRSGAEILDLFNELHGQGKTILMVTHDDDICNQSQRVIRLRDGLVESDIRNG